METKSCWLPNISEAGQMPTYLSFKAQNWTPGLQMMFLNKGVIARYVCLKTTDLGASGELLKQIILASAFKF